LSECVPRCVVKLSLSVNCLYSMPISWFAPICDNWPVTVTSGM
jgi:hypothetical protein